MLCPQVVCGEGVSQSKAEKGSRDILGQQFEIRNSKFEIYKIAYIVSSHGG
jgi:hypothetical protein